MRVNLLHGCQDLFVSRHFLYRLDVEVHDVLKSWPEQHVSSVGVGFEGRDAATLQLHCELGVNTDAEEDADGVVRGVDVLLSRHLCRYKKKMLR